MTMQQSEPLLLFEFPDDDGNKRPLCFKEPAEIVKANKIEEVAPALDKIQNAVNKGYYAAGYLSYEAAPAFDPSFKVHKRPNMPLLWFGLFHEPLKESVPHSSVGYLQLRWTSKQSRDSYRACLSRIKHAIAQGETYQVNYSMRMRSSISGDDYSFYRKLSKRQSGYNAYLNLGRFCILSASPELFFRLKDGSIKTRPMKGTVKRGKWSEEDRKNREWLLHSDKNRAENVMIVDLLRNDMSIISETGSVKVSKLFDVEEYPTVFQMTSTVESKLKENVGIKEIFSALFPCGSITGAPKVSTMNLIHELEEDPREVYCGAIGYVEPTGNAVFNVPIRTVIVDQESETAEYGVGSGITWDSDAEEEMREILAKAELLNEDRPDFQLLESLKLSDGKYTLFERHLHRLKESADFFAFRLDLNKVKEALKAFAEDHAGGDYKVRLLCSENGTVSVEGAPIIDRNGPFPIAIARIPVPSENPFLFHKTTNRSVYERQRLEINDDCFDILLYNEKGELTEFTNGNLVLKLGGKLWTPERRCGLLNGTFRDDLLSKGIIEERILTMKDFEECTGVWLINSVRGWVKVYHK